MAEIFDKILHAVAIILATMVLIFLTKVAPKLEELLKRRKHLSVENEIKRNNEVEDILNRCLGEIGADRVFFSKLHDGDSSETNKKTRIIEVVGFGISPNLLLYQSIPIGLVPDEMALIKAEGVGWVLTSDLKDSKFKRLLSITGVKGVARCAIRRNGEIIGFIGADFLHSEDKPININRLCDYSTFIEQIMVSYEFKKKDS